VTVGAGARPAQRLTGRPGAHVLRSSPRGGHERLPPGGFPACDRSNSAETFLGTALIGSACWRCWRRRAWSRSRGATRWARGSSPRALRPRLCGVRASNIPCSRGRRQVGRWDEDKPSRRHRAPTCPGAVQASAAAHTQHLSAAVKRRRGDTDETSTSRTSRLVPPPCAKDSAMDPSR
jgi:hypothetical protein